MKFAAPLIKNGWLRALLFFVAWLLLMIPLGAWLNGMLAQIEPNNPHSLQKLSVGVALGTVIALGLVFAFRKWVDRKSWMSLGFDWKGMKSHAGAGFCWGLLLICLGSLVLMAGGYLRFMGLAFDPLIFGGYAILMALIAFSEELVWRGYFLNNLLDSFPPLPSLFISAGVFAMLHAGNPSVNALSLAGVFAGGLLLGVNYVFTRNLWFGFMLHFSWNFIQGPVMGYPVSGIPFESVLVQQTDGPSWLTGGEFGIEASALSVIINLSATVLLVIIYRKQTSQVEKRVG